jgi:lamin B
VIIDEVDPDGKFIKVTNKGAEEAHIASWTLKSMAGDREISFKFHSRAKIPAGKSITVSFSKNY